MDILVTLNITSLIFDGLTVFDLDGGMVDSEFPAQESSGFDHIIVVLLQSLDMNTQRRFSMTQWPNVQIMHFLNIFDGTNGSLEVLDVQI